MRIILPCVCTLYFVIGEAFSIVLICFDDIDMKNLDWRWLIAWGSAPSVFFLLYGMWVMPESATWLQHKGRTNEAEKVLENLRDLNFSSRGDLVFRNGPLSEEYALCKATQLHFNANN